MLCETEKFLLRIIALNILPLLNLVVKFAETICRLGRDDVWSASSDRWKQGTKGWFIAAILRIFMAKLCESSSEARWDIIQSNWTSEKWVSNSHKALWNGTSLFYYKINLSTREVLNCDSERKLILTTEVCYQYSCIIIRRNKMMRVT